MIVPDCIERSNRRTLSLSVLKDGKVIVKAPLQMKDEFINRFIEDKQNWIREKLSVVKQNINKFEDVMKYEKFLLYGNRYIPIKTNIRAIGTNDKFELLIPAKFESEKVLKSIVLWYKKLAKQVLFERLKFIEERIKLKSNNFKIGSSSGRWGSCNSYGTICMNWRVVMLPPKVIDYVIVHELCHLVEMNHGKKFWNLVGKFLPNYEVAKHQIKEYGFLLSMFNV